MSSSNDDIIISGVSGRFPQSDNVEELWENLFTGKPLYGPDKFPYPKIFSRLPISRGYLKDTRFFDNNFFGYNAQEANTLDPQIRILLEVVYEAFWDAGIRPEEWRGTRTGFFLGSAFDDTGLSVRWDYKIDFPQYFAQRISYHYDWHGPCMTVDTACAASLNALHTAYWSIKHGLCDQAVVAGIALHLKPSITICFGELEMLSKSGVSWCLDERADGYIRSEAIVAVLLQRSSTCKRSYGAILGSSTSSDGYTKEGITFPRKEVQVATMRDALKHSGISASQVNYVEAHITGTAAGDPIESAAIMEAYRGNSEAPLLFGCLKSNIGHSEASAGLCALTKVIKIFQTGLIPPNINCINPNPRIESIREGYCIPVNKVTTFNDQFISIDAFGFGGSNTHVILKGPSQSTSTSSERPTLPKLIFLCNRTDKGIQKMINHIENNLNQLTNDYMSLLNNLSATKPETGMVYRAFCLIDNGKLVFNKSTDISKTRLLCYIFDDFSASLPVYTINELCELQVFKESINKSLEFIQKITIKHESKGKKGKSPVDLFSKFGSVFYQLALIDLLKSLHLEPDMIIGFGLGKIVANYASNQISWEDTMNLIIDNHNKKHNSDYNFTNKIDFNGKSDYLNVIKKIIKQGCGVNEKSDNFANHYINTNDHRNIFQSKESDWSVVRIDNNLSFLELFEQSPKKSTNTKLSLKSLLINLGEIYLTGHNPSIETFYPAVSYPVERNCPSIGHLIAWQHESTFENMIYPDFFRNSFRTSHRIDLMDSNFSELSGYHVNDQVTLPTAAYIWIVWDHLVKMRCEDQRLRSHSFEIWSAHIHRQTFIKDPVEFRVASNPVTHEFAIKLGEECCMTGYARIVDETQFSYDMYLEMDSSNKELLTLSGKEFYMEMLIRGIKVDQNCQTLTEITADASQAHIKFNGNWIIFLESCLTASLLNDIDRKLKTISYLEWFRCDPNILYEEFKTAKNLKGEAVVNLIRNDALETIAARGLVFKFPQYSEIPRQFELNPNLHHRYQRFLAYHGQLPLDNSIHRNLQSYLHLINEACDAFNSSNNWSNLSDVSTNRHSLLNILLESLERPNSIEHLKCQITNSKEILKHDQILFDIQTELSTQHLAIFEENVKPSSTVNIVHFGENHYSYQSLCYNQFRRIRSRYQFYISENESIPGKNCDLVIHTHKSMQLFPLKQDVDDINHLLEFLSNLEPSSFFMITMREQLFGWEEKLSSLVDLELSCLDNRKYFEKWLEEKNFLLISEYYVDKTVSLLFRKKFIPSPDKFYCNFIIAEEKSFKWITDLQRLVADKSQERIWLIANESYQSGIIGFIKSLNEEQFGQRIKCIFALNWDVSKNSQEFEIIKQKDLTINVLQDGSWGSYRHFELSTGDILIPQTNAYLAWNSKHISEPVWYKNLIIPSELYIVNYYSPLDLSFSITNKNYDQMKTASDEMVNGIGVEFAGIDNNGNKVIGLCRRQGISDLIPVSGIIFIQPIPDSWPLHDAASLILPYFLAYYSLFIRISLRKHSSILLYNLRDGLLEAAFAICKSFECQIYITKDKSFFPFSDITTNDVILSETNFTEKVLQATNNQGVDIILTMDSSQHLNQLTDCLADFGKILNITTKDNLTQNFFDPSILPINSSYESIFLNQFLINLSSHQNNAGSLLEQLTMMFKKGFTAGQVKPITSLVIKRDNLSQALSSLSIKGQQGRVILQLREDNQSMDPIPVNCIARTYFYPDKCYILFGGLGGIGLQLAQWMVERGARKLVFISRSGITNEYQKFVLHRIQNWPRGHVTIKTVKLSDIEYSNIYRIFRESEALGDIGGVFNLAGILRSGLFENQTIDNFNVVCKSKVILTDFLDTITRLYCPKLDHFLCFSSIASTGLLGESNYCYANAYMERICEERKADGLPGIAIQLGAVNDVGMIKDGSSQVVSSFMNQPIISYIESLDKFLQLPYSVVYSAGHAEKQEDKDSSKGSLIQRIEHILGLKDLDSLDPNVTLGDLGLDSLQAIEVKELIDKTYGVSLQNIAIVRLKLSSLLRFKEELSDLKDADKFNEKILFTITDKGTSPIFFFPPALFDFLSMKVLAENLNRSVVGIDLTEEVRKIGNIHKIAEFYCKILLEKYPNEPKYYFVGYSYGCLVSFEVGKALQKIVGKDRMNCICFIDATPYGLKRVGQITMKAVLLGLPTSEIFCIAMDNLGINISETKRSQLLEAEDDTERYNELVSEIMASAGMNGPAEGFVNNPLTSIDRGYYLTSMNELGKFDGDALFVRVLNKENHSKLSTVNEGLPKIISGKIKEVLYNASHFDVLKVYAKEIARDIEEMMPLVF